MSINRRETRVGLSVLAWLCTLGLGASAWAQSVQGSCDLPCESPYDCPTSEPYCNYSVGECQPIPAQCINDEQCEGDQGFCQPNGYCGPYPVGNCRPGWFPFEGPDCDNPACAQEACPPGTTLDGSTCFCNGTTAAPSCESAADCPEAYPYCNYDSSRCQAEPPHCTNDSDCGADQGFCQTSGYCGPYPRGNCRPGWFPWEGPMCDNPACDQEACPAGTILDPESCYCRPMCEAPCGVACESVDDCPASEPYCNYETSLCQQLPPHCSNDNDCDGDQPFCQPSGYCGPYPVANCRPGWMPFEGPDCDNPACAQEACPPGTLLDETTCYCNGIDPAPACESHWDCPAANPYCNYETSLCQPEPPHCVNDNDCDGDQPFCQPSGYCGPYPVANCRPGWMPFEGPDCDNPACAQEACPEGTLLDGQTCFCLPVCIDAEGESDGDLPADTFGPGDSTGDASGCAVASTGSGRSGVAAWMVIAILGLVTFVRARRSA